MGYNSDGSPGMPDWTVETYIDPQGRSPKEMAIAERQLADFLEYEARS